MNNSLDLFQIQILRYGLPLSWRAQVLSGVGRDLTFPQEKTVEVTKRREVTADRAAAETGLIKIIDMMTDLFGAWQVGGIANKLFKTSEIRGVSVERIGAEALLKAAEVQKGGNLVTQVCRPFRKRSRHRANDTISREMFET